MSINRDSNWGYLPDYSSPNHTLRVARKSRNSDSYHRPDDQIPPAAYVGVALMLAIIFGFVPLLSLIFK